MNARGLSEGARTVAVRAVNTTDPANILYVGTTPAVVQNGQLSANFKPPLSLIGRSYVVEICTTKSGVVTNSCFTPASTRSRPTIASDVVQPDQALYSCPYYVSEQKMTRLANLTNRNIVETDNRIGCGDETIEGSSANVEFNTSSPVQVMQSIQPQGLTVEGSGLVIAEDGALKTMSMDELRSQLTISQQTTIQYVVAPSANSTALTLVGRTLALTNGSSVLLPDDIDTTYPVANATTDGIISTTDWNTFANKENSLTFDTGLVRSGDTIGLMSCAAGQIFKSDGTTWVCAADAGGGSGAYTAGTGIAISGADVISNTGILGVASSGALTTNVTSQNAAITLQTSGNLTQTGGLLDLSNTGVGAGTYNTVTVDGKGRVTSATNVSYLTSYTETDGVIGNEVAGVVAGGGLVMSGSGTAGSPYKLGLITTCSAGQIMKWNGGAWACASDIDTDTNTDQQTLSYNSVTNVLSLTNGGTINLSDLQDNTDAQAISRTGNTISITGNASTVDLTPYLDNTDSQTLTITNPSAGNHTINISGGNSQSWSESQALSYNSTTRVISLTNGGSVTLPADNDTTYSSGNGLSLAGSVFAINAPTCSASQKLLWSGTAFTCATDLDTDTNTTYSAGSGLTLSGTTFALDQQSATTGQVLKWNGTSWAPAADVDTNTDAQSISYNSTTRTVTLTNGGSFTIPFASDSTSGLLSSADWNTFDNKENVLTFSDGLLRTGDTVKLMDCAASQILQRNTGDTAWVCANQVVDTDTNTTYSAGTGITITGAGNQISSTLGTSIEGAEITNGTITASDLETIAGLTPGTYNNVTVNAQGQVTAGTNVSYLTSYTETDGIVGNEVAGVAASGGLVMTGAGTTGDPYKVGLVTTCSNGQVLKYNTISGWACASDIDTDTDTDAQTLSWNTSSNILTINGGNTVDLSSLKDNTDAQGISLTGDTLSISGNVATVDLSKYADNTDSQTLSWNSGTRQLSLTNGGSVTIADTNTTYSNGNGISLAGTVFAIDAPTCTATEKLLWTGTAFTCETDTDTDTNTTYTAGDGITLSGTTFALDQQGATNGQVLAWDGTKWAPYSPSTFSDTDDQNLSYNSVTHQLTIADGNTITFPLASGSTAGLLSNTDWQAFDAKESVLTFNDGLLRNSNTVTLMDCAGGQILQRNSGDSAWVCADQVVDTDTTYSAGTGIAINGAGNQISTTLGTSIDGTEIIDGTITAADLASIAGLTAGTYNNVTVNEQGQVVAASNVSYLTSYTETDGVIGNEVAGVVSSGGLVMTGAGTAGDPYKVGLVTTCVDGQLLKYTTAGGWACASDVDTDTDTNTDEQTLTFNTANNTLTISGGNNVDLSSLKDNTDSQGISLSGDTLSISGNVATVDLSKYADNTDAQALSWNSGTRELTLTNGGTVTIGDTNTTYSNGNGLSLTGTVFAIDAPTCTASEKLLWTGTSFSCENDIDTDTDTNTTYSAGDGLTLSGTTFALDQQGATSGQVLGWNGSAWVPMTPSTFSDTDDQSLSYNATTRELSIADGNTVTFPLASSSSVGLLSNTDWQAFDAKESVLTFSDGIFRSADNVTLMDCAANQILQRNGADSAWVCANQVVDTDTDTNTTYSAGTGLELTGTTFANTGVLSVTASGALTSSGGQNPAITLSTTSDFTQTASQLALSATGVTAGTYNGITVNAEGRITGATEMNYLTNEQDGVVGNEVAGVVNNGGLVMTGTGTNGDPYKVGLVTTCSDGELLKYTTASGWACASDIDTDTNTDAQALTFNTSTNKLSISGGNEVDLSSLKDNTDSQSLSIAGNVISLTGGGSVTLPVDNDTTYTNGNGLSLTGTVFAIDAPTCNTTTQKLVWNGSAFVCATDLDTDTDTNTDEQALSWNNGTRELTISGGNTVTIADTNTDAQSISYNSTTRVVSLTNGGSFTLPLASDSSAGLLSNTDWQTFDGKENVLTFSDGLLRTDDTVTLMDCAAGQILQRNGGDSAWICANQVVDNDTTYSAGSGIAINGSNVISTTLGTTIDGTEITNGTITAADLETIAGLAPGTYNNITVNAQGQVTAASNISYLTSYTETDGVIGNEVAGVVNNGGLVMTGTGTNGDPYKVGLVTTCADGQLLKYTAASGWACASDIDTDTDTDAQTLSWNTSSNILTINGGNTVDLSSLKDNTDAQGISLTGDTLSISGNVATVDLSKYADNTDSQTLSWNSGTRQLSLTNGGSVVIGDTDTTYTAATNGGLSLNGTAFSLQSCADGQVLKATATAGQWSCAADNDTTYTADTGITITSGQIAASLGTDIVSGEIVDGTIAAADLATTGASAGTYGNTSTSVAQITVNAQGQVTAISNRALPTASSGNDGILSAANWNTFNGKENVLTFSDGLLRTDDTVTLMDCAANQILQRNGAGNAWACANQVTDTNTTYTAGTGLSLVGTQFSNTGLLSASGSGAITVTTSTQNAGISLATTSDLVQLSNQLGLSDTGVSSGTYNNVTVDAKGRVTGGTNVSYLTTEADSVIGNEVAGVVNNGGLVMSGAGTTGDPYKVGLITTCADGQLLKYNSVGGWACSSDTDTDAQTLSWNTSSNILTVSGGNTVDLSSLKDNTDSQTLSIAGNVISLTGGGSVTLPADQDTTYTASDGLTLTGTVFSINAPTCSGTTKLQWSGSAFVCATDVDTDTDAQTLSWNSGTRTLSVSGGNSVIISDSDAQSISYDTATRTVTLTNGGSFTIPFASDSTSGLLSSTDWSTFDNKENVLTFSDGLLRTDDTVKLMDCAAGQILQRNGGDTAWVCADQVVDTDTDTTYSAGTGIAINGSNVISSTLGTTIEGTEITNGTITTADLEAIAGLTPGTYNNVTVNAQGQVTAGTNVSYLTSYTETDGVIGNEVANVTANGGLVMTGTGTNGDPYKVGMVTTCTDGQLLKYTTAGGWACANDTDTDTDTNTDAQTLNWNTGTNILTISGGNTVDLTSLKDNTDSQTLSWNSGTRQLTLTNGGAVTIGDSDTTYSAATNGGLSLNGTAFSLQSCSSGQILKASATAGEWACASDADTTYSASTGITITSGQIAATLGTDITSGEIVDGTITSNDLNASGATAGTYGNTGVGVAQLTVDSAGRITSVSNRTLPTASGSVDGILSSSDWSAFNGKENFLTFTGNGLFSRASNTITGTTCATSGEILKWNGTAWACAADNTGTSGVSDGDKGDITVSGSGVTWDIDPNSVALGTDTTGNYVAGATGGNGITISGTAGEGWSPTIAINAPTCAAGQYLTWNGSAFSCAKPTDTNTTGVAAGTYGSTTTVPQITVDANGMITAITNQSIAFPAEVDGVIGNEVTNATANGGLARSGSGTGGSPYTLGLLTTCTDQQLLKWTAGSSSWGCSTDANTVYTAGTGIAIASGSISSSLGVDISSSEIVDGTVIGADIAADAFDFAQLADALTLDASTTISLGASNLTTNLNGTGDYAIQFGGNTVLSVLDTGAVSIGSILSDQTIGIDNGSGVINIATDSDANTTNIGMGTGSDTVRIGDSDADVAITDAQWSISATGAASFSSLSGAGLTDCDQSDQSLKWDATTGQFICGTNRATYHNVLDGNYTNNTITFTDIDNNADTTDTIGFTAGANETWVFEASVSLASNTTADSKWQVTAPSGSTCDISVSNVEQAISVSNLACSTTSGSMAIADTAANEVRISGSIKTGANSGPVTVQYGQVAASGTSTVYAGSYITAYRVSGADYAETYFTHDESLKPGMITMLEGTGSSQVVAASDRYRDRQLGIVSTAPGFVVGAADGKGRPVPLALSGRVPIILSTENGLPRAGDMITVSKTKPGYGMRASSTGYVVGQLMFDANDNGDGTANGFVYVRHGLWQAPVRLDITKLVGVSTESYSASTQSDLGIETVEFNGVDQALIDEIMKGFTIQQEKIDTLDKRVQSLESGSLSATITLDDIQKLMSSSASGLRFSGEIEFDNNITFGSNMSGSVAIERQTTSVTVVFARPHPGAPSVVLTPKDFIGTNWRVRDISAQGFTVELEDPLDNVVHFNWQAIYTNDE